MLINISEIKIYHSKIENRAVYCSYTQRFELNQVSPTSTLCQGNLNWCQGKVREMSGNFVLSSLYEP